MIVEKPHEYTLSKFQKSKNKGKKYDAILMHKSGRTKKVPFGDVNYSQYRDRALGLYTHLNNNDKKRRSLYRRRHENEDKNKYSSGYFSLKYLW